MKKPNWSPRQDLDAKATQAAERLKTCRLGRNSSIEFDRSGCRLVRSLLRVSGLLASSIRSTCNARLASLQKQLIEGRSLDHHPGKIEKSRGVCGLTFDFYDCGKIAICKTCIWRATLTLRLAGLTTN